MKNKKIFEMFFLSIVFLCFLSISSWCFLIDDQNLLPGNISGASNNTITRLSPSNYILVNFQNQFIVLDTDEPRFLGHVLCPDMLTFKFTVLPTTEGWDVYVFTKTESDNGKFGKFHINPDGEMMDYEYLLPWNDEKMPTLMSYSEGKKVLLFTTKFYSYTPGANEFEINKMPEGWSDGGSISACTLEGSNYIILYQNSMSCIWDLKENTGQILQEVHNMIPKPWTNHPGKYICLGGTSDKYILSFDTKNLQFDVLFNELPLRSSDLAIDPKGNFVYSMVKGIYDKLFVFDIENRSYEYINLDYDTTNYGVDINNWFMIPGTNKLRTELAGTLDWTLPRQPVLIDVTDGKVEILNLGYSSSGLAKKYVYFPESNRLISNESPGYISIFDIKNEVLIPTLIFNSSLNSNLFGYWWNSFWTNVNPYIYKIGPALGNRELIDDGLSTMSWAFYPDEERILCEVGYLSSDSLVEYYPKSGRMEKIDFKTSNVMKMYFDTLNDRILAVDYDSEKFIFKSYFIKNLDDIVEWSFPYSDTKIASMAYDNEENALWMEYLYQNSSGIGFLKLTNPDQAYEDHFFSNIDLPSGELTIYNHGEFFILYHSPTLYIIDGKSGDILFEKQIYEGDSYYKTAIIPVPEKKCIFLWDGSKAWKIDTRNWNLVYGDTYQNPSQKSSNDMKGCYDAVRNELIIFDTKEANAVIKVDAETGTIIEKAPLNPEIIDIWLNPYIDVKNSTVYFLKDSSGLMTTVRLDDDWDKAPTIKPQGQYLEYRPGDTFKLILDIANPADVPQDVTAYIWFWLPTGQYIFFGPNGLTTEVVGIPLTLPANLDTSISIDLFTVPQGMPAGFYNLNAVFFNNRTAVRGPMGTYNFMASQ
jgi:hypothetical protein